MEKIPLKATHAINYFIQGIRQLIQVVDQSEEQQKMSMNCIEYIFNWPIDGPKRRTEQITVACASDEIENHWVLVGVKIVHRETKQTARVIDCKPCNYSLKKNNNTINISPPLLLRPDIMPFHVIMPIC